MATGLSRLIVFWLGRSLGLNRVGASTIHRWAKRRTASANGIQDFSRGVFNALDNGMLAIGSDQFRKVADHFSAIVVPHRDGNGPAWVLGIVTGANIRKPRPRLKRRCLVAFIESHDSKTIATQCFYFCINGLGVREHANQIAKTIFVLAGPGQRRIWNWVPARLLIQRMPPAAIDRIDDRRAGKCVGTIRR